MFELLVTLASVLAGGIASVVGFGIGSILTPVFSLQVGTQVAVAAVSVPHLIATSTRFWMLRKKIDRRVLVSFGILSAIGGLSGAVLHSLSSNPILTLVFAVLLMFAGISGISGYARRMRFSRKTAWVAGGLSGLLGGLVGNQGGIRSAALLGFGLDRHSFVATSTAIALVVDAARMPVYFATTWTQMRSIAVLIAVSTAGVVAGTLLGTAFLRRVREEVFHRMVGGVVLALGIYMFVRAVGG